MGVDLRQVMAAILTFSMFVMLGNMIKRDHIDPLLEPVTVSSTVQYDMLKVSKPGMMKLSENTFGPWKENNEPPKSCWQSPSSEFKVNDKSNGYIYFSLTHGPEYHASQIANAVLVAKQLGATLALPDIKVNSLGEKRQFEEIYDVNKFMKSLDGIIQVDINPPTELSNTKLPVVRVPTRVTDDYIASNIKPIFQAKKSVKIITNLSSSKTTKRNENKLPNANAYECLAMYESLKLQPELQELVDSMVGTLRSLSHKTRGRFVAVDLRVEMLDKRGCTETDSKVCYNGEEIGEFLTKIGFHKDTTIYLTQTGWHSRLDALRNVFPNTFTKDAIMPADEKVKYMDSEDNQYEKYIDYYICSQGDVFVPAFPSKFSEAIIGERIGNGKTQILVPSKNTSGSVADYISPHISKKSHFANSCFC